MWNVGYVSVLSSIALSYDAVTILLRSGEMLNCGKAVAYFRALN
jgi:hypothetical protein